MHQLEVNKKTGDFPIYYEWLSFLFLISYQIYLLTPFLLQAKTTLTHDGFYLVLPTFHYLAKNIYAGSFPYWNYLSHGGEVFYPLIPYFKLLDGFTLAFIFIGKYLTQNIFLLFNWYHYLSFLLMNAGIYACFRTNSTHPLFRFSLMAILLFSSSFLAPFRQPGYLAQFQWTPWIVFFLLRIVKDKNNSLSNFLMLGVLMGMTWQAYWFSGTWLFLACFGLGAWLWNRPALKAVVKSPGIALKIIICLSLWLLMLVPNLVLYSEQNRWISPVRLLPQNYQSLPAPGASTLYELNPASASNPTRVSFENIKFSGTLSKITDFFQLLYPNGNKKAHSESAVWGNTSEILLYIGVLPFLISLIGIFYGNDGFKSSWLMVLVVSGLLMLGPAGGIHYLLYWVFPPLWFIRHTSLFAPIFLFSLLYFYTLGFHVLMQIKGNIFHPDYSLQKIKSWLLSLGLGILLIFLGLLSVHTSLIRDKWVFLPILFTIFLIHYLSQKTFKLALFIPLVISQFLVISMSCPNRVDYLKYFLWTGILPLSSYLLLHYSAKKKFIGVNLLDKLSMLLIVIAISYDVHFYFVSSKYLYKGQEIPDSYYTSSRNFDLTLLRPRIIHSPFPRIPITTYGPIREQSPRYPELIHGIPVAFSQPFGLETQENFSFDFVLNNPRWSPILLHRNYTDLIYSKIPSNLSKSIFAIDEEAFQFKSAVFPLTTGKRLPNFLTDDSNFNVELLKDSIYLSEQIWTPNFLPAFKRDFSFKMLKFSPNEIVLDVNSSRRGYLYWADGFDPNWKAFAGKESVPVYRANLNFKAIPIKSGQTTLKLYYDPHNFRVAVWIHLTCTVFGIGLALILNILSELKHLRQTSIWRPIHA